MKPPVTGTAAARISFVWELTITPPKHVDSSPKAVGCLGPLLNMSAPPLSPDCSIRPTQGPCALLRLVSCARPRRPGRSPKPINTSLKLPQVHLLDEAHRHEHSLEVQLPFLQKVLGQFALVPFAVGQSTTDEVAELLEHLWNGDGTLIVVSSDLSHYHDYWTARGIDSETSHIIERCRWKQLSGDRASGYCGVGGLLKAAKAHRLHIKTIDLRNSGDTTGTKEQVVGYGSFVVY